MKTEREREKKRRRTGRIYVQNILLCVLVVVAMLLQLHVNAHTHILCRLIHGSINNVFPIIHVDLLWTASPTMYVSFRKRTHMIDRICPMRTVEGVASIEYEAESDSIFNGSIQYVIFITMA